MGAKRALIVDDSRSARAFLSRILEKYEIDVETAESAEQAIEYLGHHRPDVIFMDHQMPGMDGFQAVQVIKNNPRTAMIPIMMYTSQEGELFLGQARALGAVGVLPKQIKPADVSKVLYELHLVPDRRSEEQTTFKPVLMGNGVMPKNRSDVEIIEAHTESNLPPPRPPGSKPLTDAALRELFAELRRALVASMDSQTERIAADVRQMLQESPSATQSFVSPFTAPTRPATPWGWIVAAFAAIFAVTLGLLWWESSDHEKDLRAQLTALREAQAENTALVNREAARVNVVKTAATKVASAAVDPKPIVERIPYGADALAGQRLEIIRQLFTRLSGENYRGAVDIKVYPGRFCLIGNPSDGFSLPPDEAPYAKCDLVAAPLDDSASPTPRMPLAFANLIGAFRNQTHGAVDVRVSTGDSSSTVTPYPAVVDGLTAGEWNRAGSANNRIEIRVR